MEKGTNDYASALPAFVSDHLANFLVYRAFARVVRANHRVALIAGGRNYKDREALFYTLDAVREILEISCIVQGAAPGADLLAEAWAKDREVDYIGVPARWKSVPPDEVKAQGPIRNRKMLTRYRPLYMVQFPGGSGTANMARQYVDFYKKSGLKPIVAEDIIQHIERGSPNGTSQTRTRTRQPSRLSRDRNGGASKSVSRRRSPNR